MDDWFTVGRIDGDTYVISEEKHWERTHAYLLLGRSRAALIDTGTGISNIKKIVDKLTQLNILVLTSHAHWDHIGGHGLFNNIGVHQIEVEWINGNFPLPLSVVKKNLLRENFETPEDFDLDTYSIYQSGANIIFEDGDLIDLGGRKLQVLHTPGHSPGHCVFYEKDRSYLFSGDLVYRGTLDVFYPTTSPRDFYDSIRRLENLEVKKIFPGHFDLDIGPQLIGEISSAFAHLDREGRLEETRGIFDFGEFKIHL